MYNTYQELS